VIYKNGVKSSTVHVGTLYTSYLLQPATAGAAYSFKVQAVNAVGAGPLSALSRSVTPT
jgi:hypothetical protein